MEKPKIDFLRRKHRLDKKSRTPFFVYGKIVAAFFIVIALLGITFSYQVTATGENDTEGFSFISTIKHFVTSGDRELEGEQEDRVNVLLTGIGGEGHDGPQLTDTMIFASWKPSTDEIGMISIPRDLTVPIPGYGWRKINHANAYGEMGGKNSGPELAEEVVETVFGQDIHYYVRVDFDGFAQLIDDIGGIDIYVENSFIDYEYPAHGMEYAECGDMVVITEDGEEQATPTYDCRYEVLSFEEGWTHMDGDTALKFVRSRHGTNGESSDFARSRRQQNVLFAIKNTVLSVDTLLKPSRIGDILETLDTHIATNLNIWELMRLADEFKDLDTSQMTNHVLDTSTDSPLYATIMNGAYVLLPKNDDWGALQKIAANIFMADDDIKTLPDTYDGPDFSDEFVKVEIQNGTYATGLATYTSQLLSAQDIWVNKIGNAAIQDYPFSIIYDFTDGEKSQELEDLKTFLEINAVLSPSGWQVLGEINVDDLPITEEDYETLTTSDNLDFLIILGENAKQLALLNNTSEEPEEEEEEETENKEEPQEQLLLEE